MPGARGLQVCDVTMQSAQIFHRNGTRADRTVIFWRGAQFGQPIFVLREIVEIARHRARHLANLESRQTMPDVGGIADLAHLAIAHHINTRGHLLSHHLINRLRNGGVKLRLVVVHSGILGEQAFHHRLRARQASYMRNGEGLRHSVSSVRKKISAASGR